MNFLKVLWGDIRNICKSNFLKLTLIAIILLPLAYGGLYLAAFWDPYGDTKTLPVAVVNLDQGGENDDVRVNYGDDLVDGLKENKSLGWKFVKTVQEAEDGLEGDGYYAMMVIPKDFTQDVLDVKHGRLQKPNVIFKANKKKNYIVGIITNKACETVEKVIKEKSSSKATEVIVNGLYDVSSGLETATDGTSFMKEGLIELRDKIPIMNNSIKKIHDGSEILSNDKLQDAVDGSDKLKEGLSTLKSKMPDLIDGVDKLHNATNQLNDSVSHAYDGSVLLRDGAIGLYDKLPDLSDGIDKLHNGSQSLKEGIGQVDDKMPDLIDGVEKLKDGARDLNAGLGTLKNSVQLLYEKDQEGKVKEDSGLPAIKNGSDKIKGKVALEILSELNKKDGNGISTITKLNMGLKQIMGGMNQLDYAMKNPKLPLPNEAKFLWNEDMEIMKNLSSLCSVVASDASVSDKQQALFKIGYILNGKDLDNPKSSLNKVSNDLKALAEPITKIPHYNMPGYEKVPELKMLHDFHDGLIKASMGIALLDGQLGALKSPLAMYQGMTAISSGLGQATGGIGRLVEGVNALYEGSNKLYKGIDTLYDKSKTLQDGVGLLYIGSKDLENGAEKFEEKVPLLTNGIAKLTDGTRDLSDGLGKLTDGTETLKDKVGELNEKVPDMQEGINQLYDGSFALTDGLGKIKDASGKITNGLSEIEKKMPDLQDGVDRLFEGASTLNDSLGKGAEKVSDKLVRSSKEMGNFVADPVTMDNTPLYGVEKYGVGLSPYFISLGLWIGALMIFFLVTDKVGRNLEGIRDSSVVIGKYMFCCLVGTIQAVLLSIAVMKLGLQPHNVPAYFMFNIFLSWVFMAIIQNLIFLFGDVGKLGAVLILLVQLTSSGGIFPRELIPEFFKKLNPIIPFTYSISALREINFGANHQVLRKDLTILIGILVGSVVLNLVLRRFTTKIKEEASIEEQVSKALSEETIESNNNNTISQ